MSALPAVRLYFKINKAKSLGISFDISRLSAIQLERVFAIHDSYSSVPKGKT